MVTNSRRRVPNYPILAGAAFLIISLVCYWLYFPEERMLLVVVYVSLCIYLLLLGSFVGGMSAGKDSTSIKFKQWWLLLSSVLLIVYVTVNIQTFYTSFDEVYSFLLEPGKAYEHVQFLIRHEQTNSSLLSELFGPLITVIACSKYAVFGLAVLFWGGLSKTTKLISVIAIAYYVVYVVLLGAMVNIATVAISTVVLLLAKYQNDIRSHARRIFWTVCVGAIIGVITLSLFLGSRVVPGANISERLASGFEGLVFYVSHGYVGLGYSMLKPFIWTGGETALYGFTRLFTDGLSPDSYLMRTQDYNGWSAESVWSTAVPWLASDLTYIGVPIVLFLAGVAIGRLWRQSSRSLDPFGLLLLGQLIVGVFFFPANNHLFQTFGNASGFVIIVVVYLFTRRRATLPQNAKRHRRTGIMKPGARKLS